MKRFGTLALALMTAGTFAATTFMSASAEAKTGHHDTSKKKKKKKKKHDAHVAKASSSKHASNRAPASSGYARASVYMAKHDADTDLNRKKKKSRKKKQSA